MLVTKVFFIDFNVFYPYINVITGTRLHRQIVMMWSQKAVDTSHLGLAKKSYSLDSASSFSKFALLSANSSTPLQLKAADSIAIETPRTKYAYSRVFLQFCALHVCCKIES